MITKPISLTWPLSNMPPCTCTVRHFNQYRISITLEINAALFWVKYQMKEWVLTAHRAAVLHCVGASFEFNHQWLIISIVPREMRDTRPSANWTMPSWARAPSQPGSSQLLLSRWWIKMTSLLNSFADFFTLNNITQHSGTLQVSCSPFISKIKNTSLLAVPKILLTSRVVRTQKLWTWNKCSLGQRWAPAAGTWMSLRLHYNALCTNVPCEMQYFEWSVGYQG